jgi:hypothetical protein
VFVSPQSFDPLGKTVTFADEQNIFCTSVATVVTDTHLDYTQIVNCFFGVWAPDDGLAAGCARCHRFTAIFAHMYYFVLLAS